MEYIVCMTTDVLASAYTPLLPSFEVLHALLTRPFLVEIASWEGAIADTLLSHSTNHIPPQAPGCPIRTRCKFNMTWFRPVL